MKFKQKLKTAAKGSALVYSMIILFVMLSIVLSMSAVSIKERNSAGTASDSVQAFQTANSGSELFTKAMKTATTVGDLKSTLGFVCSGGVLTGTIASAGTVTIQLLDSGDTPVDCTSDATLVSTIAQIKSTGSFGGTSRAIEVAMAATCSDAPIDLMSQNGTMLQNTSGKKLLIVASAFVMYGNVFTAFVSSSSSGLVANANRVAQIGMGLSGNGIDGSMSFVVPPNYYYETKGGTTIYQIQGWQICSN